MIESYTFACPREDLGSHRKCCVIDAAGVQCTETPTMRLDDWGRAWDDYTEVCDGHLLTARLAYGLGRQEANETPLNLKKGGMLL